ncbi:transcription factor TAFII-31, partial [Ramicandelaber brevisporus]
MPRDAVAVTMILRSLGIEECEPRVVPQLIEFVHKYTADVLQDAQVYADHAASARAASSSTSSSSTSNTGAGAQSASSAAAGITKDDVQLAIQSRLNFAHLDSSGPMAAIKQFADERNKMPLPELREAYGVRLPLDKYTLTGTNFHV